MCMNQIYLLCYFCNTLQVNNNGDLTFNAPYSGYNPQPFPISGNPMIAPFFADVDTRGTGKVWYRVTNDSTLLAKAVTDTRPSLAGQNFAPMWLFIATWDHVGYYNNHTDKVNMPQAHMHKYSWKYRMQHFHCNSSCIKCMDPYILLL